MALLAVSLAWQGKLDEAAALRSELGPKFVERNAYGRLAAHWLDAVTGDRDASTGRLIEHAALVAARGHRLNAAMLLHAASRLGAAEEAAPHLRSLAETRESPYLDAQAAHASAEAAGDLRMLEEAASDWERSGHLLFAAEALASAAGVAAGSGKGRESSALRARADQLVASCEGAATPLLQFSSPSDPLTNREREIAALAAQGLSSIEIAERLFLSPRTVNNHLQAAYSKLGIRGRGELPRS